MLEWWGVWQWESRRGNETTAEASHLIYRRKAKREVEQALTGNNAGSLNLKSQFTVAQFLQQGQTP